MSNVAGVLDGEIEGALNLRDLGGLPAGNQRIRQGLVFRSAMTHHITHGGLERLAAERRIRSVVDFRGRQELSENGVADWVSVGISHHHLPVNEEAPVAAEEHAARMRTFLRGEVTWSDVYEHMSRSGVDAFRRFFTVLADDSALSVVFHCSGGRDRTGVAAALLLSSLGVPDDVVASDYARTGELLRAQLHRFTSFAELGGLTEQQLVDHFLVSDPTFMLTFLEFLRRQHGSTAAYLESIGVDAAVVTALRRRLLEPA